MNDAAYEALLRKTTELLEENTKAHLGINTRLEGIQQPTEKTSGFAKKGYWVEWIAVILLAVLGWIYTQDRIEHANDTESNLSRIEEVTKIQNQVVAKLERIFADHLRYEDNFNLLKPGEKPRFDALDHDAAHRTRDDTRRSYEERRRTTRPDLDWDFPDGVPSGK